MFNTDYFKKVYDQVSPLGILGSVTEQEFFTQAQDSVMWDVPDLQTKFLQGDPALVWEFIIYHAVEIGQGVSQDWKWSANELLVQIDRVLGGGHSYQVTSEATLIDGDIKFVWDGKTYDLKDASMVDFMDEINTILWKGGNTFRFVQIDTGSDTILFLKLDKSKLEFIKYFPEYLGQDIPQVKTRLIESSEEGKFKIKNYREE